MLSRITARWTSSRSHVATALLVAMATVAIAAVPEVQGAASSLLKNAKTVGGFGAVKSTTPLSSRKGKLVATDSKTGRLPNNIIQKAPDSAHFEGMTPDAFTTSLDSRYVSPGTLSGTSTVNAFSNPVDWTKLKNVPAGFADGTDAIDGGTAAGLSCTGCVTTTSILDSTIGTGDLAFNVATQTELDALASCTGCITTTSILDSTIGTGDLSFDVATQTELDALGTAGTINTGGNPVDWTKLKNVPAGFADGTDAIDGGTAADVSCTGCVTTTSILDSTIGTGDLSFDVATQTELDAVSSTLSTAGIVNTGGNPVDWTKLKGVPTGFADGVDNMTTSVPVWSITSLYASGVVTAGDLALSAAAGVDGLPIISFYDQSNGSLDVAACTDIACTSSTVTVVDVTANVGEHNAITIAGDGLPLIAYYTTDNQDLKVAHCSTATCSTSTTATLDSGGDVGRYVSLTTGSDGYGVIAYRDQTSADLKVVHCSNAACTGYSTNLVDSIGDVGTFISITVGMDGLPLISYLDVTNDQLKVAHCGDKLCSSGNTLTDLDASATGQGTSIQVAADGLGLIAYAAGPTTLKTAHCSNVACSSATYATVVTTPGAAAAPTPSLSIGSDGLGTIAYRTGTSNVGVVHCADVSCATAGISSVSSGTIAAVALTIAADGNPLVVYDRSVTSDLRALHCSNVMCIPYARRR